MKKQFILCLLTCYLCCSHTNAQPNFITKKLEKYIVQGMKDFDIPGLAISILKDGKTVYSKGFGLADIKTNQPVDENTLFFIASNSKLFTGTALAQLEVNKKLLLNDKITKYYPGFQLFDSLSTAQVTIRDMLGHHLGTKTFLADFTFWGTTYSRNDIMDKMKLMKPSGVFRQDYGYCNSCFLTAGQIIPIVTGKPWEVYIHDSILTPLGMNSTYMLTKNANQLPNMAKPYTTLYTGKLTELPYDEIDNIAPAGSMISNITDMSKWLQMQLDSGLYNGNRILKWAVLQKTRDINTALSSRKSTVYPTHFRGYGLGVFMSDYNGRQIFYHTGGAFGFVTNTCFVPEEKLAIVILTNQDGQNFFEALRYQILDAYLQVPFTNRATAALQNYTSEKAAAINMLDTLNLLKSQNNQPPLAIENYVGIYKNELYGTITLAATASNALNIHFDAHAHLNATLTFLQNDEWELKYNHTGYGVFKSKFKTAEKKVTGIAIKAADFIEYDTYFFTKQ